MEQKEKKRNLIDKLSRTFFTCKEKIHIYPHRQTIKFVKRNLGKNLVGAEIGVLDGLHSENMLKTLQLKKLYLIDPYISYKETYDGAISDEYDDNWAKEIAHKRLSRFSEKIEFIEKTSDDAVKDIKEPLDFVYIDGSHNYENVLRDIQNYYKKVKVGGVVGGHDFRAGFGVPKAVIEFAEKNKIKLDGIENDWWFVKAKK